MRENFETTVPTPGRPLLVTADPELLDETLQLADAAGASLDVIAEAGTARPSWIAAPLVLVGLDSVTEVVRLRLPRRAAVVLVSRDLDDATVWEAAGALGAEHVVFLPDAALWLTRRIREAVLPRPVPVVCTIGGRGGAGASTLAVALALVAVARGRRCMLVDADPLGGGLDLMLGEESAAGTRWPDVVSADRAAGDLLLGTLPRSRRAAVLSLLSWDRGDPMEIPSEAMSAALAAGRRDADLVIVDLPRRPDAAAATALACRGPVLLVVPAEVRATAAAARVIAAVERICSGPDLRVVVRGPAPSGLSAQVVAAGLGLPLAGHVRADRRLAAALERADPPGFGGRGPWVAFCNRFLDELWAVPGRAVS
jgi:secretion/DNA translocation related CpaE-like protein